MRRKCGCGLWHQFSALYRLIDTNTKVCRVYLVGTCPGGNVDEQETLCCFV